MRGLFAEWLVGVLLGLKLDVREDWVGYDLQAGDLLIEVKCAAYLQNWAQIALSKPVFGSLRNLAWDPATSAWTREPAYNSHWYIFCLHTCTDGERWDILDLQQWEFYLVPREKLAALGLRTIALGTLKRLAEPMTARRLRAEGRLRLGIEPGETVTLATKDGVETAHAARPSEQSTADGNGK